MEYQDETGAPAAASTTESPFLGLPAELRNRIYRAALIIPEPVDIELPRSQDSPGWQAPGLLQTCRTIRAEALAIYYTNNTFLGTVQGPGFTQTLVPWLRAMGVEQRRMIRAIRPDETEYDDIYAAGHDMDMYFQLLADNECTIRAEVLFFKFVWVEQRESVFTNDTHFLVEGVVGMPTQLI
ncbi:hypothetical protein LTR85_005336 [Meristemomyces frigidus]|nr:hypothetical protein LTR85_005336 [Meristemomyces frigidus]